MLLILRGCLLVSVALLAALPATSSTQESTAPPRLLSAKEGRSVVNAAWEHREQVRRKPDCSHLVHQIYALAGFSYPYASSFDLYDGTDSFRRVTAPHPGDLVVWPGHVGIVVDPAEHTFYSSVQSGLRTEAYDGPYWRSLGRPRFYRYIRSSSGALVAAKAGPGTDAAPARRKPSGDALADPSEEPDSPAAASATAPPDRPIEIPSSIVVAPSVNRPTVDEVSEAVSELSSAAGNLLRSGPPLDPQRPVSIYDQFAVERLEFKRDRAWAHIRMDTRLSIAGEKLDSKHRREKLRWELRRTPQGWQLFAPAGRAYVPRDVAVHILASQLALLTHKTATPSDGRAPHDREASRDTSTDDTDATRDAVRRQKLIVRALALLFDSN